MNLYYECHVTTDPIYNPLEVSYIKDIAAKYHFRMAELFLQKRLEDTPDRSKYDSFFTTRTNGDDRGIFDIEDRCRKFVADLMSNGFKVRRYKIEIAIVDSNTEDIFGLLNRRV